MTFEIDVLIIFSEADNTQKEGSWVTQFKRFLDIMLTQVLGEQANIQVKSETDNMIAPTLNNVAVLVPVLSENFIRSGQCSITWRCSAKPLNNKTHPTTVFSKSLKVR